VDITWRGQRIFNENPNKIKTLLVTLQLKLQPNQVVIV